MQTFPHLVSRSHSAQSLLHGDHDSRFQRTPAKKAHGEKNTIQRNHTTLVTKFMHEGFCTGAIGKKNTR